MLITIVDSGRYWRGVVLRFVKGTWACSAIVRRRNNYYAPLRVDVATSRGGPPAVATKTEGYESLAGTLPERDTLFRMRSACLRP